MHSTHHSGVGVRNDVVEGRFQLRLRALHRQRIQQAQPVIREKPPQRFTHLDKQCRTISREQGDRNRIIEHENGLLVNKMVAILGRSPKPNHDPVLLTAAAHATVEDAYRPGPIPLPKSLNKDVRARQLESIVLENEKFLQRLISSPGVYSKREWEKQFTTEVKYMESICKFPFKDPQSVMPHVNPILAIATAQSNKTAEQILKKEHAQLTAQSGAIMLPAVPGSSPAAFGATQGFGSSFGSTTGSLPPYPPSAGSMGQSIPNHFPMPPHGTQSPYPSPPPTAGQPNTARPSTSAAQGPRLRAQYTMQGVRILRSGRTGASTSRPSTSTTLDSLRHHSSSGSRTPKQFQPLRQQNAAAATSASGMQTPHQQQQHQQQPQHAHTGEEHKEDHASHSHNQDHPSSSSPPATAAASASIPEESHPPPANAPIKLFEDTLVISNRPVFLRLYECGSPWRLELRCFDPFSKLEYNLSLPFTYIKLCFYQVPDLLLIPNRPYLVQTLLHYLVFAPAQANSSAGEPAPPPGSLELLVDIVAPQPRTEAESHAWQVANDEAMLDQEKWSLEKEKQDMALAHERALLENQEAEKRRLAEHEKATEELERIKSDPKRAHELLNQVQLEQQLLQQQQEAMQQQQQSHQSQPLAPIVTPPTAALASPPSEETIVIHRKTASTESPDTFATTTMPVVSPATAAAANHQQHQQQHQQSSVSVTAIITVTPPTPAATKIEHKVPPDAHTTDATSIAATSSEQPVTGNSSAASISAVDATPAPVATVAEPIVNEKTEPAPAATSASSSITPTAPAATSTDVAASSATAQQSAAIAAESAPTNNVASSAPSADAPSVAAGVSEPQIAVAEPTITAPTTIDVPAQATAAPAAAPAASAEVDEM